MKRTISLLAVVILIIGLTACGNKESAAVNETADGSKESAAVNETADGSKESALTPSADDNSSEEKADANKKLLNKTIYKFNNNSFGLSWNTPKYIFF